MPKVSIIVPVYKAEKYLQQCIDSILAQTFTDWECILVDDGSPDISGAICDEYAQKETRIKVFHKENGGVSSARNLALDEAKGEWIYFCDADDELYPYSLQTLVNGLSPDVGIVMAGYELLTNEGEITYMIAERSIKHLTNEQALLQMYEPKPYKYQGYLCTKLFNRACIEQFHLRFDPKIYFNEDRLFTTQYLCCTKCDMCYNTKPIYKYFARPGSAMVSLQESYNRKYVTDFNAYVKMFEAIKKYTSSNVLKKLATIGVIKSYIKNVEYMTVFKDYDSQICRHMQKEMRRIGVYSYYIKREIRDLLMLIWPSYVVKHS